MSCLSAAMCVGSLTSSWIDCFPRLRVRQQICERRGALTEQETLCAASEWRRRAHLLLAKCGPPPHCASGVRWARSKRHVSPTP
eukprot:3634828-Prymnesium_polylepis.2